MDPGAVLAMLSKFKNGGENSKAFVDPNLRALAVHVAKRYESALHACNAVDFDDILLYTARLLEENPSVRDKYAQRFRHVLVDEFQDTNLAQYALVRELASFNKNIFVVGDPDQSIYAWRGADWRNVQRFEQDFPDAQTILLEQNYRSRQNILNAAMGVINVPLEPAVSVIIATIAGSPTPLRRKSTIRASAFARKFIAAAAVSAQIEGGANCRKST